MSNTLDTIMVVGEYKALNIREITDTGRYHRRVLTYKAEELWTDEVKSARTTFQAEQEAQRSNQS